MHHNDQYKQTGRIKKKMYLLYIGSFIFSLILSCPLVTNVEAVTKLIDLIVFCCKIVVFR